MPCITNVFMLRVLGDRAAPVPAGSKNFSFISQFTGIPVDVLFTVECSVRVAQMKVYELLDVDREVPPVAPHAKSHKVQFEALLKAIKCGVTAQNVRHGR